MVMEVAARLFILEKVLVDPLMADGNAGGLSQPARYLLRAPLLADQEFDPFPGSLWDAVANFLASAQSKLVRLFWAIASLPAIAFHFPTDRGLVNSNKVCDLRLVMSCFQKYINLVSLFIGELLVDTHPCSFDLAGLRSTDATAAYLLFQPSKLHL